MNDHRIRIIAMGIIGMTLLLLALLGILTLILQPNDFLEYWNRVCAIIQAVIFSLIGFVVGRGNPHK